MKQFFSIVLLVIFCSCGTSRVTTTPATVTSVSGLKFISEYVIPHKFQYAGTTVGGLSGIDHDATNDIFYLISDDRSQHNSARFYTSTINISSAGIITDVQFQSVHALLQPNANPFPSSDKDPLNAVDPEAIRFHPAGEIFWSSEGERIVDEEAVILRDPFVYRSTIAGAFKDSFQLSAQFKMRRERQGPRRNGTFEGMTFGDNYASLFVSMEEPLWQDGARAGLGDTTAVVRFIKFDVATRKPVAQYAYKTDAVAQPPDTAGKFKVNGVTEILWAGENKMIVVERSFSSGQVGSAIKVFLADLTHATNIAGRSYLPIVPDFNLIQKKLLLNMDSLNRYIDNIEGVTFGPRLANGNATLIFVSDDNFSPDQKTQLLLFEILP